jgi:amidase
MKRIISIALAIMLGGSLVLTGSGSSTALAARKIYTVKQFNVMEASIADIQKALKNGDVTSEQLVDFYIKRINKFDKQGPKLNSIIAINPKAFEEARALDKELKEKGPRSPLHGVPIILKDNFDTFDMPTTGGNLAMKYSQPTKDAFLTKKLRDAGAIIIAKANLHELARAGWTTSSLGGQTLNPYDLTRTPGGSSGGTGTAIAANFAIAGMGSDTVNSVRSPASANSLVGLRPTYGLLSRTGVIPAAMTQDMAGPITRTVADAAVMMSVMAGVDPADPATKSAERYIEKDYTKFLDKNALKGKRIGVVRAIEGKDPEVLKVFDEAISTLEAQGAVIVNITDERFNTSTISKECDVQKWESNPNLDDYFKSLGDKAPIKSSAELIATKTMDGSIMKLMNDSQALYPNNLTDPAYKTALENGQKLRDLINKTFKDNKLDAFFYPHQQVLVSKVTDKAQPGRNGILASIGMTPAITVPGGFSTPTADAPIGVPVGVEFMGQQWSEPTLLAIAYAFEQATQVRMEPKLNRHK